MFWTNTLIVLRKTVLHSFCFIKRGRDFAKRDLPLWNKREQHLTPHLHLSAALNDAEHFHILPLAFLWFSDLQFVPGVFGVRLAYFPLAYKGVLAQGAQNRRSSTCPLALDYTCRSESRSGSEIPAVRTAYIHLTFPTRGPTTIRFFDSYFFDIINFRCWSRTVKSRGGAQLCRYYFGCVILR